MKLFNPKTNLIKAIFCLSTFVALSIFSFSCKDNDDKYIKPELVVNSQLQGDSIVFEKDGGSKELTFTSNRKWEITSSVDWIAVDPSSGDSGDIKVMVKALANAGVSRSGTITISSIVAKKSIVIKQNGEGSDANFVIFDESFANGLGCWTTKKLEGAGFDWTPGKFVDKNTQQVKETYAKISAYDPGTKKGIVTKSLLISPMVDFKTTTIFSFKYKSYFAVSGTTLKVVLLNADKEIIGDALQTVDTNEPAKGFAKTFVDVIVAVPLNSDAKYIALYYEADETHTTGFEVTDLKLLGGEGSKKADCDGSNMPPVVEPPVSSQAISSFSVDFSDGNMPKDWTTDSKTDSRKWKIEEYQGKHYAKMNAYNSKKNETAYLTTPLLDLSKASTLTFNSKVRYAKAGTMLEVVLLDANHQNTSTLKTYDLDTNHEFELQTIEIPADDNSKYIAFVYKGDSVRLATIQLTDITLKAKDASVVTPEIEVNTPSQGVINFAKDGGSQELSFTSNAKWMITTSADWISVDTNSGDAGNINVMVKASTNTGVARTGSLTISSGMVKKNITINQEAGMSTDTSVVIFSEMFIDGLGCWTTKKLEGAGFDWTPGKYQSETYAKISAFDNNANPKTGVKTRSILVSPMVDFKTTTIFSFKYKSGHAKAGTTLKVVLLNSSKEIIGDALEMVDTDQPVKGYAKDWKMVTVSIPLTPDAKYVGLLYEGDEMHTTTFEVTELKLLGGEGSTKADCGTGSSDPAPDPNPAPAPDPNPAPKPNPAPSPSMDKDLFFVAYVEGSSNNKYLSIYNPNDKEVDLSNYTLKLDAYKDKPKLSKPVEKKLTGKIPAKGVIVYKNSRSSIYTGDAIELNSIVNFNGNDNIALFKGDKMIDVIGSWGNIWVSPEKKKGIGADVTLHRKTTIDTPSATFDMSQWDELSKDDVSILGKR